MTQLLVLGLLKKEPLSGYDIQCLLQTSDAESWGGVLVGSIYHALKKLEQDGYLALASIEQTGHRQKSVYRITQTGIQYFDRLLLTSLQTPSVCYPTQLYAGLNFLDELSPAQAAEALLQQKAALGAALSKLAQGKAEKEQSLAGQLPPVSELVFAHMRRTLEQQIDFLDHLLAWITG